IGRVPDNYAENSVREAFNNLMRQEYSGREPLFDLAALEASRTGAPATEVAFNGRTFFVLRPEYSTDGGHLTADARQRIAAELLGFVAGLMSGRHNQPLSSTALDLH
ncbi:MAG: hypothetical protein ABI885_01850, partial [Gammaproteobacteria bacterium]